MEDKKEKGKKGNKGRNKKSVEVRCGEETKREKEMVRGAEYGEG